MKQGIQDTLTNDVLKKYGCYFLSIMEWASRDRKEECDIARINKTFAIAKAEGWVEQDCTVLVPHELYNYVRGKNVFKGAKHSPTPEDTCIIRQSKPGHTHFILQYAGAKWDPLPPHRPGANLYRVDDYRLLIK